MTLDEILSAEPLAARKLANGDDATWLLLLEHLAEEKPEAAWNEED